MLIQQALKTHGKKPPIQKSSTGLTSLGPRIERTSSLPQQNNVFASSSSGGAKISGSQKKKLDVDKDDFLPKRFALNYNPPMIILEYMMKSKGKLYLSKIKLYKLQPTTPSELALKYIKDRYWELFETGKISDKQVLALVDKLKAQLAHQTATRASHLSDESVQAVIQERLAQASQRSDRTQSESSQTAWTANIRSGTDEENPQETYTSMLSMCVPKGRQTKGEGSRNAGESREAVVEGEASKSWAKEWRGSEEEYTGGGQSGPGEPQQGGVDGGSIRETTEWRVDDSASLEQHSQQREIDRLQQRPLEGVEGSRTGLDSAGHHHVGGLDRTRAQEEPDATPTPPATLLHSGEVSALVLLNNFLKKNKPAEQEVEAFHPPENINTANPKISEGKSFDRDEEDSDNDDSDDKQDHRVHKAIKIAPKSNGSTTAYIMRESHDIADARNNSKANQPSFPNRGLSVAQNPLLSKLHQLADEEFGDLDDFDDENLDAIDFEDEKKIKVSSMNPPPRLPLANVIKPEKQVNRELLDPELEDYNKQEDSEDDSNADKYYSHGDSAEEEKSGDEDEEDYAEKRNMDHGSQGNWTRSQEEDLFQRVLGEISTKKNPSVVPEVEEGEESCSPSNEHKGISQKVVGDELADSQPSHDAEEHIQTPSNTSEQGITELPDNYEEIVEPSTVWRPVQDHDEQTDEYADEFDDQFDADGIEDSQQNLKRPGEAVHANNSKHDSFDDLGSFDDVQDDGEHIEEQEIDYEKEDEDDHAIMTRIFEREREYLQSKGATSEPKLEKINLNKLNDREVAAVKRMMDQMYQTVKPGDEGYVYDIEKDFDPAEESNEWDKSSKGGSSLRKGSQVISAGDHSNSEHTSHFSKPTPRQVKPSPRKQELLQSKAKRAVVIADEELDMDFEEDFNDDLDEFDEDN
jgi:CEP19-like protein